MAHIHPFPAIVAEHFDQAAFPRKSQVQVVELFHRRCFHFQRPLLKFILHEPCQHGVQPIQQCPASGRFCIGAEKRLILVKEQQFHAL